MGASHGLGEQKTSTRRTQLSRMHFKQNSPRQVCSSRGVIKADENGQATNHAGSSIPIIEHAQIDIHAVHPRELIWPTTNDRGVTCFARDAVRTTRRKTNIQDSFLKHAMQSKTHAISNLCISDFAISAGHLRKIQTYPGFFECLGKCSCKLARVCLRLLCD